MNQLRDSAAILHVGMKRTGKTTASLQMMVEFVEKQGKPVVVLDLGCHPSFDNFRRITLEELPKIHSLPGKKYFVYRPYESLQVFPEILEFCTMVSKYVRNAVVFFEDFTTYVEGNFHPIVKGLILNSRNSCNDYVFNVHSFSDVGPFILKHCEIYLVRETIDDPNNLPPKIPYTIRPTVKHALGLVLKENQRNRNKYAYRIIYKEENRIG